MQAANLALKILVFTDNPFLSWSCRIVEEQKHFQRSYVLFKMAHFSSEFMPRSGGSPTALQAVLTRQFIKQAAHTGRKEH